VVAPEIRRLALTFADDVAQFCSPRMVVLYGSQITGQATPTSDIDIAVIMDSVPGDYLDFETDLYRIRRHVDDRIEPVLLEIGHDDSGFLATVMRQGEILFQRGS